MPTYKVKKLDGETLYAKDKESLPLELPLIRPDTLEKVRE